MTSVSIKYQDGDHNTSSISLKSSINAYDGQVKICAVSSDRQADRQTVAAQYAGQSIFFNKIVHVYLKCKYLSKFVL